ncbi:hypothetical protein [Polyangium spumosum]|uniref:Uncharacterized protein n=1 Tax=Polyangium spumosum TaxID=889282 RepID=A0A6N7Q111_9BACT|nr:hypothetical protein [Polyangium spumosum]MRG96886.1 hypothetical protein [Polyangium spumosum]
MANALAEGINCIAAFVKALRDDPATTPDPDWVTIVHEMERALDGIVGKEVSTDMVVREEDRDRVRRLRALVSDWVATGKAPDELQSTAEAVLMSFGITV